MIPSIGRIVIYNHAGSADGKYPPMESPAVVQKVNSDGTLELFVMSVTGGIFFAKNVKEVEDVTQVGSRWSWPVKV